MKHLPKSWRIIRKTKNVIEVQVKQARDTKSVFIALFVAGLCFHTWLQGSTTALFDLNFFPFNALPTWGVVCLVVLPFAIAQVFLRETWLVEPNFLMVRKSLLWFKRERYFRNAHFEFVTHEQEKSFAWALKVCSAEGGQEIFFLPIVNELDDVALLLSQQTG